MSSRKITLVLTELVIVIFILAMASAYCLSVFANASEKTKHSENLRLSALSAQNAAECWKSSGGDIGKTVKNLENSVAEFQLDTSSDNSVSYTDENFHVVIEAQKNNDSTYVHPATVSIYLKDSDVDDVFFTLEVSAVGGENK